MAGSQLGLAHLYAEARHQAFVAEAEGMQALRVAESAHGDKDGRPLLRLRSIAGAVLIALGERVKGAGAQDAPVVPASSLRLAR